MFHFIINSKNYPESAGPSALKLADTISMVSCTETLRNSGVQLYLATQAFSISQISARYPDIFLLAQHLDNESAGSTTGHLVPQIAKMSGAKGSLLNHSEHRIPSDDIQKTVQVLRTLNMTSVVCAKNPGEVREFASFNPDFIAIEPPELIGSGRAVSKEKPELISDSKSALEQVRSKNQSTILLCGAGIVEKIDVTRALELGADGILVASGVIKSNDWDATIISLASGFARSPRLI